MGEGRRGEEREGKKSGEERMKEGWKGGRQRKRDVPFLNYLWFMFVSNSMV